MKEEESLRFFGGDHDDDTKEQTVVTDCVNKIAYTHKYAAHSTDTIVEYIQMMG